MRFQALVVVALLAFPALAAEDSTGPTISNVSVTPTATNTSAGAAFVTICMVASDDLSGITEVNARFTGTKSYKADVRPWQCEVRGVSGLGTCNTSTVGRCYKATDCTSSDNCSAGGGSTVETVVCDGSSWVVKSTTANPTTLCRMLIYAIPRYAAGGEYTVDIYARDRVGNSSNALDAATVTNTP